jgi:hypothetical protein
VRWPILALASVASCAYPDFAFQPADAAIDSSESEDVVDAAELDAREDATLDTLETTADSSVATDAIVDAKADSADTHPSDAPPDVTVSGYCATGGHDFCVDFDESTEPTYGWSSSYTNAGGTLATDSTAFSAPRSFFPAFPAGTVTPAAMVTRALDAPTSDAVARIDLRIRFDTASFANGVMFAKLQRDSGHGVSVWLGSSGFYAESYGVSYKYHPASKTVGSGTWYHVRLEASLQPSGARVRLYVDDMSTALVDVSDASSCTTIGTSRELAVGLYGNAGSGFPAFSARIDDVSLDWL